MKMINPKRPVRFVAAAAIIVLLSACAANRVAAPVAAPTAVPITTQPTVVATLAAPTEAPKAIEATATSAPTAEAAAPTATTAAVPAAAAAMFKIDESQSKASFTLDEKLMGNPKTVVGTSAGVSGDITVDMANPAQSKIGKIQIDASQFATDSSFRDRALKNFILQTTKEENKFITFEPTAIEGMPAKVAAGEAISFKVTGNLTIRGTSKPATFDVTVTPKSETELTGSAKTTVMRSDFQLEIPKVPSVADVTDAVTLELTFVATKAA